MTTLKLAAPGSTVRLIVPGLEVCVEEVNIAGPELMVKYYVIFWKGGERKGLKMFDINQVITDHINTIRERGVRDWLTELREAGAFRLSVDALIYYVYQGADCGVLTIAEMRNVLGVLEAVEANFLKGFTEQSRSNGGVLCDNPNGACSCGAWDSGDSDDQI